MRKKSRGFSMRSFKQHLTKKLKDEGFRQLYSEEKQLAELSLKILDAREHLGLHRQKLQREPK